MAKVEHLPERGAVELGPRPSGYQVIVDGRAIPRLLARRNGDMMTLILDGRFSIDIPADRSEQICWFVANAMAIGAGHPSLSHDGSPTPFAPRVACIEIIDQ